MMRHRGVDARFLARVPWCAPLYGTVGFGCAGACWSPLPDGFMGRGGEDGSVPVLLRSRGLGFEIRVGGLRRGGVLVGGQRKVPVFGHSGERACINELHGYIRRGAFRATV